MTRRMPTGIHREEQAHQPVQVDDITFSRTVGASYNALAFTVLCSQYEWFQFARSSGGHGPNSVDRKTGATAQQFSGHV